MEDWTSSVCALAGSQVGGKGKGMTRLREYIHTRMNVHGGTSGLRRNTKGKYVHAHYPRLHFNLPILQQDSGSTSLTHVQHRVGAATGTFFSTTRKRQDKWDQEKDIQLKTKNLLAVFCNLLTKKLEKLSEHLDSKFFLVFKTSFLKITFLLSENYPCSNMTWLNLSTTYLLTPMLTQRPDF